MKWCRKPERAAVLARLAVVLPLAIPVVALGLLVFGRPGWADLADWVRNTEAGSVLEAVFFRSAPLPAGAIVIRRPPRETRAALTELISHSPSSAELVALRAREDEQQLDFATAESDWRKAAALAPDPADGKLLLADFYHRRLRPKDEIPALTEVARAPSPESERLVAVTEQRSWKAFERIHALAEEQALVPAIEESNYQAWLARYPNEPAIYQRYFDFLLAHQQFDAAEQLIARYEKTFPDDRVFPVTERATLEFRRGSAPAALALYEREFQPLWPPELVKNYFALLGATHQLRYFLTRARTDAARNPDDLNSAVRLFYYYQQQGNMAAAERALIEFRLHKESHHANWTADELYTLARLFEDMNNFDEASRCYYALYSLPGASSDLTEKGLGGLAGVLLEAPEQPIRFGAGNLTFYRDVATMDPYPGFLNGLLSLLLNGTEPGPNYASEEQLSVAYFHRAEAERLVALFDQRFPKSARRRELQVKLLQAYSTYGANDGVIRGGRGFLASFPDAPERTQVALMMAEAYARTNQTEQELALYDVLLKELAARADGVPLGEKVAHAKTFGQPVMALPEVQGGAVGVQPGTGGVGAVPGAVAALPGAAGARSPEYARVLDLTIARLVALKQPMRVLELYRREIDRDPDDPGLYERLAAFLEANNLGANVEETYRLAMARFPDRSWYQKLARWYLRRRRQDDFAGLTQEVVKRFSGSDLETYVRAVVNPGAISPQLYLEVNLYAHQRFPHNLTFVHNLLNAYQRPETADHVAWERLIRGNWFYDDGLRSICFEYLSGTGKLDSELAAARPAGARASGTGDEQQWQKLAESNPAAARFVAEGEAWRSHFEAAAPVLSSVARVYPAQSDLVRRAAALNRSLAAFIPADTGKAAAFEDSVHGYDPRDHDALTRLGEIYADREMLGRARLYWNAIAKVEPGQSQGYLEAATVFWDYFMFDDALRLLAQGRKELSNPALYAYEAGAIYENKRDYAHAIDEYLKGALATPGGSTARARLLELARRPARRAAVEEATAQLVSGPNPDAGNVGLRVAVLEAEERRSDLEALLTTLADGATTVDLLEQVSGIAQAQGFDNLRERSLEREITMTIDPVDRMRLRLALAQFEEGRHEVEKARNVMESLYQDNPMILGVVRATVDFYWRNKMTAPAVDLLTRAAGASHPELKKSLTFEAASKSIEAGDSPRARTLLAPLLQDDPFNAQYLATMSESYAREGDDRGLRDFTLAKIEALRTAALAPDERTNRIAALRRGLIPALTRLKDFAGAVDQYIEIINRYPEDQSVTEEAAAYAGAHGRKQQLVDYYSKTAANSPRDFRWPMVLARLDAYFEDFPSAITAYNRAITVSPDRADLYMARAALEERLMRFDDAAAGYTKTYELTYHDPQWMQKLAEIRARQGGTQAAVEALQRALVEGRPERPAVFFAVAAQLETWNMLADARRFAERGIRLADADLLTDPDSAAGAKTYARILTRLGDPTAAYQRLEDARRAALAGAGSGRDTAALHERLDAESMAGLQGALKEIGVAAGQYFTPEEKASFAAFLEKQGSSMSPDEIAAILLPLAERANFTDLEARWWFDLAVAQHNANGFGATRLIQLQRKRMRFGELGKQLEALAGRITEQRGRSSAWLQAAEAYRSADDADGELRALSAIAPQAGDTLERYLELLRVHDPQRLLAVAGTESAASARDAVANFAIANTDAAFALKVIGARSQGLPPVWARGYMGLVGLYDSDLDPGISQAFTSALGDGTIGERIGKPVDRKQQMAGDVWFYYGSRYGEYLALAKQGDPENYLPAQLEGTPAHPEAYIALADYYSERKDWPRALDDYRHALELDPLRGEVDDRIATILWDRGQHAEAEAQWRSALEAFRRQEDKRGLAPAWSENVRKTLEHVGAHRLLPGLRNGADDVLRDYIHRNGSYNVQPLLEGAMAAAGDPAAGVQWIIDLSHSAANPIEFLGNIVEARFIPEAQHDAVYQRVLELAQKQVSEQYGEARGYAQSALDEWRIRWIGHLVATKQAERAQATVSALPEDVRKSIGAQLAPLEVQIAAQTKTLDTLLDRYRREPNAAPPLDALRAAAASLRTAGDADSARRVLAFVYTGELDRHNLDAANFLGLAEVCLEENRTPDAVALLNRMTLVSGQAFEMLEPAADLLEKYQHPEEAVKFLAAFVQATPWDAEARRRLAQDQLATGLDEAKGLESLRSIAGAREATYATRAEAATAPGHAKESPSSQLNAGSAELDLLAGRSASAAAAEKPFFYYLRFEAAKQATATAERIHLLLDAIAIKPEADRTRIPLFHAAFEARRYQLAVETLEPLTGPGAPGYYPNFRVRARRMALAAWQEGGEPEATGAAPPPFLAASGLNPSEQASLERDLASAYQHLNRLSEAERHFETALRLASRSPIRVQLKQELEAVRAELNRQARDTARRPVVSQNLEQPNLVRPRLFVPGLGSTLSKGGRDR